jgi:hypothetical protein
MYATPFVLIQQLQTNSFCAEDDHLFIYSFIHLFIYSFIHLFIYSFIYLYSAEPIRLALEIGGVAFDDKRIAPAEWKDFKVANGKHFVFSTQPCVSFSTNSYVYCG